MAGEFKLEGMDDLEKKLVELAETVGPKDAKKVVRTAMKKAAAPVRDEAKRLARRAAGGPTYPAVFQPTSKRGGGQRGPGHMADTINARISITKRYGAWAFVAPSKSHWYAAFQEFGTPLSPAKPFLRPALDKTAKQAVNIIASELRKGIEKIAK